MFGRIVGEGGRGFGVDRDEQASEKRFSVNIVEGGGSYPSLDTPNAHVGLATVLLQSLQEGILRVLALPLELA